MGQRLLLVDNDRSFLKEHQVSLEAAFDLEVTGSPEGVLARLESGAFAAVFISVEVADNKGYALCSAIRKNAKLDGVKIVLISAKATTEEYRRHQSLKGHADLYLHKPISPSALVAELRPLVPGLALDPDNPLGELVDTELGDDWLDGLKSVLDGPTPAQASPVLPAGSGPRPPSPAQTQKLDAKATTLAGASRQELLEGQVAALQEELHAKDQRLREAEAAALQSQRQLNSVTLNLDELERSNREAEVLKARLAETGLALRGLEEKRGREGDDAEALKAQLKEALNERQELIQQVETLNHQVGEKAQRAIELLKERDRLLHENIDLQPFRAKSQDLEAALGSAQQELEEARQAQDQLHATIEGLVAQQASLEGSHQAALLEVAGHKEKTHTYQLELAGLEATMRGQGRDLAELGVQLRQLEADLAASQARVLERDQQLAARQEVVQQHLEEITRLAGQLAAIKQEQDESRVLHEGQQLELMHGLDEKETEISRLNQLVADQLETYAAVEREKQTLSGQLSEHRDRLQNLDGLLQEIQDKLRRGSDLARG
jgi:DNA-binding response OmpR family regulator